MRWLLALCVIAGCGDAGKSVAPAPPAPTAITPPAASGSAATAWPVPDGWRSEVIPFPLDFAPTLAHTGVEELRFPPGFFDPASPDYWSYAFVWRTADPAQLDAAALADELTRYFQGLIAAVDQQGKVTARDTIAATARADGARFALTAHVFDAFKTAQPLDLVGWAERRPCGSGALWVFVLAPAASTLRGQLDELAALARCA